MSNTQTMRVSSEYQWNRRRIITTDGEGQDTDCKLSGDIVTDAFTLRRHAYNILAAGDDKGFQKSIIHDGSQRWGTGGTKEVTRKNGKAIVTYTFGEYDVAPNYGLTTVKCLNFLLSLPRFKSDLIVAFSFTYDTTKILQDLPLKNLKELADYNETKWRGYEISLIPRKFLTIKRGSRSVTVNDVFSFWQMSFVKALESSVNLFTDTQKLMIDCRFRIVKTRKGPKWEINRDIDHPCKGTERPCVAYMKDARGEFDHWPTDKILTYCYTECEYLSVIVRDFVRHMAETPIELPVNSRSISGPGGLAGEYFQKHNIKNFMPNVTGRWAARGLPLWVPLASYYGGHFETFLMGNFGNGWEYDLHSAYPAKAWKVPCLRCGRFKQVDEYVPGARGFYLVGSKTWGKIAPFPFRVNNEKRMEWATAHGYDIESRRGRELIPDWFSGATNGAIAYAHGGVRWVTDEEVRVARKYFGDDAIPVLKGYVYHTSCKHRPFADLERLYLVRKEGNPSEGLSKIIKLLLNSIYGKLAQTIGAASYRCHIWAAWITGGTRASIMEAGLIAGRKDDCPDCTLKACDEHSTIGSMATDGILVSERMNDTGEFRITNHDLGTWEESPKDDIWLGLPGIYGFGRDDTNDKGYKRRGLNRKFFPISHLRDEWDSGELFILPIEGTESRAFMPFKLAVQRRNSLDVLGEWPELPKSVNLTSVQHKRYFNDDDMPEADLLPWAGEPEGTTAPEDKRIRLETIRIPDDLISEPYARSEKDITAHYAGAEMDEAVWEPEDFSKLKPWDS